MGYLRFVGIGLFFVANLALAGGRVLVYFEQGDAGDRHDPQNVSGGPYGGFFGNIGEGGDTMDAFRFTFAGGEFNGSYSSTGPTFRELYTDADRDHALLHSGDSWGILSQGVYVIEFSTSAGDPPYTFELTNLNFANLPISAAPSDVPEPGALALMLAGVAGLGALRRRAKAG